MRLYRITMTMSAATRGKYAVPEFFVEAATAKGAADKAALIALLDRRTTDGHMWTLEGVVVGFTRLHDRAAIDVRMVPT